MESLLSAIDDVAAVDTRFVSDDDLECDVATLSRAVSRLRALMAQRAAEAKRRDSFRRHGLASLTRWLAHHGDLGNGEARALVGLARTMRAHPETGALVMSGELSATRATLLSRLAEAHPKLYERDEVTLLGLAAELRLSHLSHALRRWRHYADDTMAEADAATQRDRAYVQASVTWAGMVRLDGLLDRETGEAVLAALDAATPAPVVGDGRSASNRRAEALGAICEQWLRNGTVDGGLRAAVTLTVDLDSLDGRLGPHCDLERSGPVTAETARRILCDADVTRVVTRGDSEILDVGRATRVPSPAQRKALHLRDGQCRFVGCERPAHWCDTHHIVHWLHGGPTDLDNLILLCRRHHTMVHDGSAVIVGHDACPARDGPW